jgi:hypothetical protein
MSFLTVNQVLLEVAEAEKPIPLVDPLRWIVDVTSTRAEATAVDVRFVLFGVKAAATDTFLDELEVEFNEGRSKVTLEFEKPMSELLTDLDVGSRGIGITLRATDPNDPDTDEHFVGVEIEIVYLDPKHEQEPPAELDPSVLGMKVLSIKKPRLRRVERRRDRDSE